MSADIQRSVVVKGITRLCHFTPSRNLQHIAARRTGVLATKQLTTEERLAYNATDLERLDGHVNHVCCSIEFPNAWYLARAQQKEVQFPDWVVLLIKPDYLWKDGTLFSPRNAAAGYGANLKAGSDGFEAMYAASVPGAYNRTYARSPLHHPACPTDQQAEVLVEDRILLEDVLAIAVRDADQAATERVRLRINGVDPGDFNFLVAPHMFSAHVLDRVIRQGLRPSETIVLPAGVADDNSHG